MRERILDFVVCPACKAGLDLKVASRTEDGAIKEGSLICKECQCAYPVINFVPRFVNIQPFVSAKAKTKKSFGYQWTRKMFSSMIPRFKDDFLNYIYPVNQDFFRNKIGVDIGCGFGRHIYYAATFGAEMVGVDFSSAIDSAYNNTKGLANVHLVQADIYNLPLKNNYFDFVYSIGVLHHTPSPETGFGAAVALVKPAGCVFIWVYSKTRVFTNFIIESMRLVTRKMPCWFLYWLSIFFGVLEEFILIPYKALRKIPFLGKWIEKIVFNRIKLYAQYPFSVVCADWFDRLSAPIRYYYDQEDMKGWFSRAGLKLKAVSPTAGYGWRALGEKL